MLIRKCRFWNVLLVMSQSPTESKCFFTCFLPPEGARIDVHSSDDNRKCILDWNNEGISKQKRSRLAFQRRKMSHSGTVRCKTGNSERVAAVVFFIARKLRFLMMQLRFQTNVYDFILRSIECFLALQKLHVTSS